MLPATRERLMDKLAERLREDARQIDGTVSDELERRIQASLEGVTPEPADKARQVSSRPAWFWWASSLTGIAAAAAVIAILNVQAPVPEPTAADAAVNPLVMPAIDWQTEAAVLTSPLEQEIEDLQSDLKKAEEAVRQDIDRLF